MKQEILNRLARMMSPLAVALLFNLIEQLGDDNTAIVPYQDQLFWFKPRSSIIIKNLNIKKPIYYHLLNYLDERQLISKRVYRGRIIIKIHFETINGVLIDTKRED